MFDALLTMRNCLTRVTIEMEHVTQAEERNASLKDANGTDPQLFTKNL